MAVYKTTTVAGIDRALFEEKAKNVFNSNVYTIPSNHVLAWLPDGSVTLADATDITKTNIAGISITDIPSMASDWIVWTGKAPGVLAGLVGVSAGDAIFLSEVLGELTTNPPENPDSSAVIRVGFAVPADGTEGPITDLVVDIEIISRP